MLLRPVFRASLLDWSDQDLQQACIRTRDEDYFSALFDRYRIQVNGICHTFYPGNEPVCNSLTGEVFVRLYEQLQQGSPVRHLPAWLYRTTVNCCRNHGKLRGRYRQQLNRIPDTWPHDQRWSDPVAERAADRQWQQQRMAAALARLPERQQQCLQLFFYERLTYDGIAGRLNLTVGEVRSALQNGKLRLRRLLT